MHRRRNSVLVSVALICFVLLQLSLLSTAFPVAAATNLIANPSVETPNNAGTAPLYWQTDAWGKGTATFTYSTVGYNSNRNVQVNVSNRTSGDAKWYFDPVAVAPNSDYVFSDYYRSDVKTKIVAMSLDASNKATYFDLATPAVSTTWSYASVAVRTLASTSKLTIFHLMNKNGYLQMDETSLVPKTPVTTHTITASAGTGGSISPSGAVVVADGGSQAFSITPSANYKVADVKVDGSSKGAITAYTFTGVTADHTIAASFAATTTELVPNNSLEQAVTSNPNMPTSWLTSSWGSNRPTYQYMNEGHTGSRSVKVTMANYVSGDAKWYFEPQTLTPGQAYRCSLYYKTNVVPHVVAMFLDANENEYFLGMPDPQPNGTTDWQYYSDTFVVPSYAKTTTVFFFLTQNGWVQTDDYHLETYQPTGFNRPLVTLTVDDSFEDNVSTLLPKLQALGLKATQFVCTQFVEGGPGIVPDPNAQADILAFKNAGFEIGSHSVTHPFLTQMTTAQVDYELSHSQAYLRTLTGATLNNFASPYGDYNASVNNEIRKYYRSHRTVDEGYNSKDNFDPYRIRVQNMQITTTMTEYQSWLDRAKATNTWLVIVYHRVTTDSPEQYDTTPAEFDKQMAALVASGMTVKTYNDALTEVGSQMP
jgi:peptidoglycan/xylan/chitin deacetylase (PgdA/CDA1 family)